ncbi:MAG: hypothetical protein CDV28_1262 [Candidatus Electronema aureum]|uniref:Uncharacterized protein n=1 Tax=Candidatus Electronema aureum TaxID=2005002 RepID=A0A521G090_9BACT|nr:MAG: hypothetical protein CDV28_1262 [Candidatus Electronema aureum]
MRAKAGEDVFAIFEFEILAVNFHGDDFFICQGRFKAALTQPALLPDDTVLFTDNQKDSDNKTVSIGALLVNRA